MVSLVLLIVALFCFGLAALGFNANRFNLIAAGLFFYAVRDLL